MNSLQDRPAAPAGREATNTIKSGTYLAATRSRMSWKQVIVAMLCMCLMTSGCTTLRTVPVVQSGAAANPELAPGRDATIVLKDGSTTTVTVLSANPTGIVARSGGKAEPVQIPYADMQSLQIRRSSPLKTTGLVLGSVIVVLGVAAAVYIDAVTGGE